MANSGSARAEFGQVTKALAKLETNLGTASLTANLGVVHSMLLSNTEKMFDKEKDPQGRDWAPLSPATIEIRKSLGYEAGPINVRTGKLRKYMTPPEPSISGHSDAVVTLVYPGRQIPDKSIIRRLNQSEGIKRNAIKRSVLGMSENDVAKILVFMNNSLFRGLRG